MEKPACIKTHMRNVLIMSEMIGSVVDVHNGKTFKERTCSSDNDRMFQYASDDANLEMKDTGDHFLCASDQDTHILSKLLSTHEEKQEKVNGCCCF